MNNPLTLRAPESEPLLEYERDFDAPVQEVFRAHVDPDLYTRWVGPKDVEFLLQTFEFESDPDVVTLEYSTVTALPGGGCRLTGRSLYPSVRSRDRFLINGIEEGMSDGYNQLDDLLGSIRTEG